MQRGLGMLLLLGACGGADPAPSRPDAGPSGPIPVVAAPFVDAVDALDPPEIDPIPDAPVEPIEPDSGPMREPSEPSPIEPPAEPPPVEPIPPETPAPPSEDPSEEPSEPPPSDPTPACTPSPRHRLFELFPESPVAAELDGSTLTNATYAAGTAWAGLDERQVFRARLVHREPGRDWDLRIGKGSQIYSLRGPFGEAIPPQRPGEAEWVDEVIQTVAVNRELNERTVPRDEAKLYMIHQAGVYERRLPDGVETFYSPILGHAFDGESRRYATLAWPQQAHAPSDFQSRVLFGQDVRDVGAGAIEVTHVYVNFGAEDIDFLAAPWMPLRRSTLPVSIFVAADGSIERREQIFDEDSPVPIDDTAGYFVFARALDPTAPALAVVFGAQTRAAEAFDEGPHRFRWGIVPGDRDLRVVSVQRLVRIPRGSSFFHRYYFVVGTLADVRARAAALVGAVDYGPIAYDAAAPALRPLCRAAGLPLSRDCAESTPSAWSYAEPIARSRPLFLMRSPSRTVLSVNPYELTTEPYLGGVDYELLGFGVVDDTSCAALPLVDRLTASFYPRTSEAQQRLAVRSSDCACP